MGSSRGKATWRRRVPRPLRAVGWKVLNAIKHEQPGLLMRYQGVSDLVEMPLPPGYELRPLREGDQQGWVALLNESGAFGEWDYERLERETHGLIRSAQFFVEHDGELVAATGVLDRPLRHEPALEIGWVVRAPNHTGMNLGRVVVVRALHEATRIADARTVYLYTDDHRLTAIALYLDIGFVPDLVAHRSYKSRWQAVFAALDRRGAPSP
ncbi:MAG: GNAT family N-acetyltransferase [bacterium]